MNCHKSLSYVALLETEWLFSSLPESKRTNFRTLSKNIRISFITCQLENEFSIRSRLVMHCNSNSIESPSLIYNTLLENTVIESAFFSSGRPVLKAAGPMFCRDGDDVMIKASLEKGGPPFNISWTFNNKVKGRGNTQTTTLLKLYTVHGTV